MQAGWYLGCLVMTRHKQIPLPLFACEQMAFHPATFYRAPLAGCPTILPFGPQVYLWETDLEHRTCNFLKRKMLSFPLCFYRYFWSKANCQEGSKTTWQEVSSCWHQWKGTDLRGGVQHSRKWKKEKWLQRRDFFFPSVALNIIISFGVCSVDYKKGTGCLWAVQKRVGGGLQWGLGWSGG